MANPANAILFVCRQCLATLDSDTAWAATVQGLRRAGVPDDIVIAPTDCLQTCDAPVALALSGEGMAGYVFAGIDLQLNAADIGATCRTYLDSHKGWIEDARPCGALRFRLRARTPAGG